MKLALSFLFWFAVAHQTANADELHRAQLAEEYASLQVAGLLAKLSKGLLIKRLKAANLDLSDEEYGRLAEALSREFRRSSYVIERSLMEAALETYNTDELQALTDFFGSEIGLRILKKMPEHDAKFAEANAVWVTEIQSRVLLEFSQP